MALLQSSCSWWWDGLFGWSFSIALPARALRGLPYLGRSSVVRCVRHTEGPLAVVLLCSSARQSFKAAPWGVLLCSLVHQVLDRPACLLFSCWCWHVGRVRLWWWLHPLRVTQQYPFASMAAWLFSTGISHHSLLPHIHSLHLATVNSSPHPAIAPQSLRFSSQPLYFLGDMHPCPGYVWLRQGLSDSYSI